jgi:hypothetical protein
MGYKGISADGFNRASGFTFVLPIKNVFSFLYEQSTMIGTLYPLNEAKESRRTRWNTRRELMEQECNRAAKAARSAFAPLITGRLKSLRTRSRLPTLPVFPSWKKISFWPDQCKDGHFDD